MDADRSPLRCVVVEDDAGVRSIIALALRGFDVHAENFTSADAVLDACDRVSPDVIILDIALRSFDAIDVVRALAAQGCRGAVQLISGHHALLDIVQRIGVGGGLTMLEPLRKPFRVGEIRGAVAGLRARASAA